MINRRQLSDLHGVTRLTIDATVGVTDIVEKMHHTIQIGHPPVGVSRASRTSGITGLVYSSVRGITRLCGMGLDAGMTSLGALLPEGQSAAKRDALVSVINGIYGDHFHQTGNPLEIVMSIRYQDISFTSGDLPAGVCGQLQRDSSKKIMLFVHGLCLSDRNWTRGDKCQAEILANKLGYSPLFLRYNTGLSITENGQQLAALIADLLQGLPSAPEELVIVGHSMGGLVARSAVYHGGEKGHAWLQHLDGMLFLGTPHQGAPLERGGNWLDRLLELSPYAAPFARIAKKRSAGISDLRDGCITGPDGKFILLPDNIKCYAVAGTLAKAQSQIHQKLIGDGLVPVDSAFGLSNDPERHLQISEDNQYTVFETGHMDLLGSAAAFDQLANWLG